MAWHRLARAAFAAGLLLASPMLASGQEVGEKAKKPDRPPIYNENADPHQQVVEAIAKARHDNKRVLVMLGGNWCGWCHKLHDLMKQDREIARLMLYEYELVMVDSNHKDVPGLLKQINAEVKAVPYLIVLDGYGKSIINQPTEPLEDGDHHDPAKVLAFLKEHVAKPKNAEVALKDALAEAEASERLVFLHFGAPWCGWCHKLEDFLARDDMKHLLGTQFVDLKIDVDRMEKGKEVQQQFRADGDRGGIPWFAFLDAQGKVLATSDAEKTGNVGYPAAPAEIDHFIGMLTKTAKKLSPDQIAAVKKALEEAAAKLKAPAAASAPAAAASRPAARLTAPGGN